MQSIVLFVVFLYVGIVSACSVPDSGQKFSSLDATLAAFQKIQNSMKKPVVPSAHYVPLRVGLNETIFIKNSSFNVTVFNSCDAALAAFYKLQNATQKKSTRKRRNSGTPPLVKPTETIDGLKDSLPPTQPQITGEESTLLFLYCCSKAWKTSNEKYNFYIWLMRLPEMDRKLKIQYQFLWPDFDARLERVMEWMRWRKAVEIFDKGWDKKGWPYDVKDPTYFVFDGDFSKGPSIRRR